MPVAANLDFGVVAVISYAPERGSKTARGLSRTQSDSEAASRVTISA